MNYIEEKRDLFIIDDKYYLAHCISKDAKMGAGIAVEFRKRYPELESLSKNWRHENNIGECRLVNKVFNLITKERYWHKPTYSSLEESLISMRKIIKDREIKYLAMPKIGCGLDRLTWNNVRILIKEVFKDTDIEILVCFI